MRKVAITVSFLSLLIAFLLGGCSPPQPAVTNTGGNANQPSPGDAVKAWNDALTKGDVKAAESLTSSTSKDHIKQNFGSLEQLSASYRSLKNVKLQTKIIHEEISGDAAVVVYRVQYGEAKVKYWMDKLYLEGGEWKVAPQFVQMLTLKE
jgi:hypothetical protein